MDIGIGKAEDGLADLLEQQPGRFEPVTALRVAQSAAFGELDVGSPPGVAPMPLAVYSYERKSPRQRIRALFASLTGPLGSLPHSYNELVLREERNRSRALSAFFDLFNGRLAELFADASDKYRLARRLRWKGNHEQGGFVKALLALSGLGTRDLVRKAGIEQELVVRFSGYFADRTRHATGLRSMLADLTGLPVRIEQFRPRWLSIPLQEQTRLGSASGARLGINTTAGNAVRDLGGSFRIVIGPLGYADYQRFSPRGRFIREVVALTRLYVGPTLDFDVQIVLQKDDIPYSTLGPVGMAPQLGWNSWARSAPAIADSGDAVVAARTIEKASEESRHAS